MAGNGEISYVQYRSRPGENTGPFDYRHRVAAGYCGANGHDAPLYRAERTPYRASRADLPGEDPAGDELCGRGGRIRQVVQDEALGNEKRRPATITAGTGERSSGGIYYVSKVDLMAGLRTSLELKGLEFGEGLTQWKEFRKQMLGFGGTAKDDLVLAVALAAWGAKVGAIYGEKSDGILVG